MAANYMINKYLFNNQLVEEISSVFFNSDFAVLPGFCDVHVHFREPGFSYKETIKTGSMAAARGGYTAVCTMPNLNPVPDCAESIKAQLEIIERDAVISVYPYSSITKCQKGSELVDFNTMSEYAVAFSDDGKGVQSEETMKKSMECAEKAGKIIVAHCEDESLLFGGYIHAGEYAAKHNHRGICSKSEWGQIERDLFLAEKTGCPYHVCHISTKESVDLIRKAKAKGVDVTCETAPHYLVLDDGNLREDGKFKMNPPLRSKSDREALVDGLIDGTIDMIATDHAPHSKEEKNRGLEKSAFGIVGLETAFPIIYTKLVKSGILTLDLLVEKLAINPRKRFSIPINKNDITVWDLADEYEINPDDFLTMGRATPFEGEKVFGRCLLTLNGGKEIYKYKK